VERGGEKKGGCSYSRRSLSTADLVRDERARMGLAWHGNSLHKHIGETRQNLFLKQIRYCRLSRTGTVELQQITQL
jgi:hypothetical protein